VCTRGCAASAARAHALSAHVDASVTVHGRDAPHACTHAALPRALPACARARRFIDDLNATFERLPPVRFGVRASCSRSAHERAALSVPFLFRSVRRTILVCCCC
jgi:hypothetical protein